MNDVDANAKQGADSKLSLSIAMATYNGERFLRAQLQSLARQTRLPLELVVADDGSTDATMEIVAAFARTAPFPVRCFRNERRLGYGDNFLRAALLCRGDLIAFCDQDDIWLEDKLLVCASFFADPKVLLTVHSGRTLLPSGEQGKCFPHFRRTRLWPLGSCDPFTSRPGFAIVVRKTLLSITDNTDRPENLYSHDHWVWFLAASAGSIITIADVLCFYRQHAANIYGAPRRKSAAEKLQVIARIPEYDRIADMEIACAKVLANATETCPPSLARAVNSTSNRLFYRARLHSTRAEMYRDGTALTRRAAVFASLIRSASYLHDRSKTRLGLSAAIKDVALGLTGLSSLARVWINGVEATSSSHQPTSRSRQLQVIGNGGGTSEHRRK